MDKEEPGKLKQILQSLVIKSYEALNVFHICFWFYTNIDAEFKMPKSDDAPEQSGKPFYTWRRFE